MSPLPSAPPCHVCSVPGVGLVARYETFRGVTSDCRSWASPGRLAVCRACGVIQKAIDDDWRASVARIYDAYAIYHQSDGAEQPIFEQGSGLGLPRSLRLIERARDRLRLPQSGRLLDVGCGNGAFVRAFGQVNPEWSLSGLDLDDKYAAVLRAIPGFRTLYVGGPEDVPETFDLVTMIHALEHIPQPAGFLGRLWERLVPDGLLLVQVPDARQNPFDLLVADHCSHFDAATLEGLVRSQGFEIVAVATDWIPKEITLVGRRDPCRTMQPPERWSPDTDELAAGGVAWLEAVRAEAKRIATHGDFGIFGTSIAGTWLGNELGDAVRFFVDEDPTRVGKTHLGRPILHPDQVSDGADVFIGLPTSLAETIKARLEARGVRFHAHVPPPVADRVRA